MRLGLLKIAQNEEQVQSKSWRLTAEHQIWLESGSFAVLEKYIKVR